MRREETLLSATVAESTDMVALLRYRAAATPQQNAYVFLGDGETVTDRLSYSGLDRRARAIAARLQAAGLAGRRALLLYPSGLDFVAAFFGCLYAGTVAVPAYPPTRQHRARLMAVTADAAPAAVLTTAALAAKPPETVGEGADAMLWLATGHDAEDAEPLWQPPALQADSLAFLQYTSGSTADPKGVMVSHGNLMANQRAIRDVFGHTEQSTVVGWLPLYHDMGLIGNVLQPLYVGATAVLMPPMAFLEKPVRWLQAITEHRAATSGGPDFAYELCVRKVTAEHKLGLDLSAWQLAFDGSEPVRTATLERFVQAFESCGFRRRSFFPCYGLAEATLFVTGKRYEQLDGAGAVSCGTTQPGHGLLIVDPANGEVRGEGHVGEVWISGPSVAQGYWNRPEESAATFRAQPAGLDGTQTYLRTGDLGYVAGDELVVAGRIKDLIILRGRNVYPQDIELALVEGVPALRPGGCVAFPVERDGEECVAVVAELAREAMRDGDYEPIFAAMRQTLAESCDVASAELALAQPGAVPKTSSGKIRRQPAKQAYLDGTLPLLVRCGGQEAKASLAQPAGSAGDAEMQLLQQALAAVPAALRAPLVEHFLLAKAANLLGVGESSLAAGHSLSALGMDSLKLVELKYATDRLLGADAPLSLFFSNRTVAELAEALAAGQGIAEAGEESIPHSSIRLSYSQHAMWTVQQMAPDDIGYNLHLALRIAGPLKPAILEQAFGRLWARHIMLRTVYRVEGDGVVQRVLPPQECPPYFAVVDAAGQSAVQLQENLAAEARKPFDLAQGPLCRAVLYRQGDDAHTLLLCAHHIAVDLWSLLQLLQELNAVYQALAQGRQPALPPLAAGYGDFAARQFQYLAGPAGEAAWDYWRARLDGELPLLALPTDRPRPSAPDGCGASVALRLDAGETGRLRGLAKQHGATLFTLLLAAYKTLLHRYTHQDDIIVGVPTSGRSQARFAPVVGNMVNPVPLRTRPSATLPFADYLAQVRDTWLGAGEHQDYPFSLLVERLQPERNAGHWPIYQTLFVLQQAQAGAEGGFAQLALGEGGAPRNWGDWSVAPQSIQPRVENFDLKLMAAENEDGLLFSFQYRSDLFDAATMARLAGHYRSLLQGIAAHPGERLGELPLLTADERQAMASWNATLADYPQGRRLHQRFEAQAEKTPEAVALVFEDRQLSYRQLNERANHLAHALLGKGVRPATPIGIGAQRSLEMVVGLLGILKAGCAYLPLDPDYPTERLVVMAEDAGVALILAQPRFMGRFAWFGGEVAGLEADPAGGPLSARNPHVALADASPAYVLFTSGSTGRPKGVAIPHRGICNRLWWMQDYFGLDAADAVLQKTPYTFDVSVWEFFWPLLVGSRLVLAGPDDHKELDRLIDLIGRHGITTVHFVPSMLNAFLAAPDLERCGSLRRVVCSGEAVSVELQKLYFDRLGARFFNLYGPTEASVDVTAWECAPDDDLPSVPIGRPVANTAIHLLDERLNPVPVGVAGELHIGGVQLAWGYLNRPELTAERFVPDPFGEAGSRLYKTGDLARYRPDGAIEYLGRIDHQVKIRGFRIELGEIEARLLAHPQVREAAVIAREDAPGNKRLVAYVAAAEELPETEALRAFLLEALPDYMVPAAFVMLDGLPLSANGKLDRKALPAPDLAGRLAGQYVAPRDAAEALLARIWAEVLRLEQVGVHDNFFDLGGDSILAIQAATRAHRTGLAVTPRLIFQHQTVAALAQDLSEAVAKPEDENPAAELEAGARHPLFPLAELSLQEIDGLLSCHSHLEDIYPLTPMQEGLLFHTLLYPHSGIYLMQDSYDIDGEVDAEAFRGAWQAVIDHHPILRTSFFWDTQQRPHQLVHRHIQAPFELFDWRGLAEAEQSARLARLLRQELDQGLDFQQAPLLRLRLFRLGEARYRFVRSYHHILLDEWCTSEIFGHFLANYEALAQGRTAPPWQSLPFCDYIAWLQRQNGRRDAAFWQRELAGFDEPTPLVVDNGTAESVLVAGAMEDSVCRLSEQDSAALAAVAQRCRVTPNTLLQAAWALLLGQYSGRGEVLFGVTVAGRPAELPGVEHILGLFINSLPLRVQWAPDMAVAEFLQALLRKNLELRQYEHTSLLQIQSWLGLPHNRPLFDSLLVFENAPIDPALLDGRRGLDIRYGKSRTHTNYPITVVAIPALELHLQITYQRERFDAIAIERMLGHFKCLLEGLIRRPEARLGELSPLTAAELGWIAAQARGPVSAAPQGDFAARFAAQAAATPDAVAVSCRGEQLSYRELERRADRLAAALAAQGVGPDTAVALLERRGIDFLAMMLAVFKAGGAYLPLDPEHPRLRLAEILRESRVRHILAGADWLEDLRAELAQAGEDQVLVFSMDELLVSGLRSAPSMAMDPGQPSLRSPCRGDGSPILNSIVPGLSEPSHLAYVIYTSGSTGAPKGAMVERRGMLNNLLSKIPAMDLSAGDVIAQTASQCFDISVWQFLTALVCGARVEILPDEIARDPKRLLEEISRRGVTVLEAVPSLMRAMLDVPGPAPGLEKLRWLLPTGEALPPALCRAWMQRYPQVRLLNAYGPAECSDDVAYHFVTAQPDEATAVMPIGRPLENLRLHLLDPWLRPVPLGVPGELCVAGMGVGRGYLNRPELTAERFLPNPFAVEPGERLYRTGDLARYRLDGEIEFLGRVDHQVKIRGYRVELGEIEAHLLRHPQVRQAAVAAPEDRSGARRLVAYVAPEGEAGEGAGLGDTLRAFLKETLPDYMVPSVFVPLERLPVTPNGKIDRKALPEADAVAQAVHEHIAPRNGGEEILAGLWREVLGVEQVGATDNFFDLGGHSLLAVQLLARIHAEFGVQLSLLGLFEAPTVERLAALVEEALIEKLAELSDDEARSLLEDSTAEEAL